MSKIYKYYDLSRITHAKYTSVKVPFTLYSLIATWFFIGRIPIASGTLGSLAFYPVYYFITANSTTVTEIVKLLWLVTIVCFFLGIWAVTKFQNFTKTFDHSYVVIDEIVGMGVTLALSFEILMKMSDLLYQFVDLKRYDIVFLAAFMLFRVYDIKKPLLIKHIDRYYKNPFGVMIDDVIAGLFAFGTFYIAYIIYDYTRYL